MVKKFKNGNINIVCKELKKDDSNISIDDFYSNVLTMQDLYFNQINGYMYLVDNNTSRIYDFSFVCINILQYLQEFLEDGKILKIIPVSKKYGKSLLEDLENGY